jgi:hypothetical protein
MKVDKKLRTLTANKTGGKKTDSDQEIPAYI